MTEAKIVMYPTVVYDDQTPDTFFLVLRDLQLITEGNTVEEAYEQMVHHLEGYMEVVSAMGEKMETASTFESVSKAKRKNIVLIVSTKK